MLFTYRREHKNTQQDVCCIYNIIYVLGRKLLYAVTLCLTLSDRISTRPAVFGIPVYYTPLYAVCQQSHRMLLLTIRKFKYHITEIRRY